jgi:hypothetical protein
MRYYKKANTGVKVKKSNGEPPEGVSRINPLYMNYAEVPDSQAPAGVVYNPLDDSMEFPYEEPEIKYTTSFGDRLKRQLFKETSGVAAKGKDPNKAVSPSGAKGLWQIMPATQKDLEDRGFIPKGLDPFDPNDSRLMRDAKITALLKTSFISNPPKPIPEVNKLARIYAAYNFGEGNVRKALNEASSEGVNIYGDPRLWLDYLPNETSEYVKYILFDE